MGKLRQYWIVTVVVILAMFAAGYFLGVKPQAAKAAKIKAETAVQADSNAKLSVEIKMLKSQAAGVTAQRNRLRQIDIILPSTPGLPKLVRDLTTITGDSGVALTSVAPGPPTPLVTAVAAAPVKPVVESTTSEGAAPRHVAAPAPAALLTLPVTLALDGDFTQLQLFLSQLESLDRSFLVDSLSVTPTPPVAGPTAKGPARPLSVAITGHMFIKPATVAAVPAKSPVAVATQK